MNASPLPRKRGLAVGAIATLVLLLMLPNLLWLGLGTGANMWRNALVIPAVLLFTLFALFGKRLWIACLLLAPFALLAPLEAFYIATYRRPTFAEIIATLVATNPREMREYLGVTLVPTVLCVIAALLLALLAAWWSHRTPLQWRRGVRAWVLTVAVTALLGTGIAAGIAAKGDFSKRLDAGTEKIKSLGSAIQYGYPFGLIQRIVDYRNEWNAMRENVARMESFRFHAHRLASIPHRQVYVLVIGEASRRANWQLFGYDRATNPELSRIPNVVPITNMDSSWPESITAIPDILTRKPVTDIKFTWWKEASVLRAMQEAGFETYWFSDQQAIGKYDSPVSTYAFEAQHAEFLNHASWSVPGSYDEVLLQPLRDALADSNRDLFIVLHMMGSHQSYDYRYTAAYKRFQPTESDTASSVPMGERIRNGYDNTIVYSDHVLASIIDILRENNAVTALWYESDHGESLKTPTCNMEGHGHGTHYEYEISAFSWYSDAYASEFPARVAALRANARKRTMSADTFESLIDMAGLEFPGHDPSWSLFSTRWRYRPRIVNRPAQIDIDRARFSKACGVVSR
jgi:glucan phosphoethanolaminetransferase (alkaline phosphatase superfamily)